ncbi:RDD family protein [Microbacterium sp. zg.Y1090]|uniref:RDD family protein n=1 Tax=Microbacterium TaxID=33882 RepID=UPI00214AB901|nr:MULTISPECIES: RDD family protein [unclassified Microbacterium]MCR2811827.1 RDD family protein [Microbacterium sp. zg.Y1084]MCR2818734.1 RDD family protein [Microbacterium sp. zg.Y1090]MDL5486547.1 RDD family protein [Microbacterium sp. zg-Y1211]WIM27053.1 RDD family protein [Microbacterium sp. zg-Y1090]
MPETPLDDTYPGERLGLPATGAGSLAPLGRRVGALFIDYTSAYIVAIAITLATVGDYSAPPLLILALFAGLQIVFIPTLGGSPGHRLLGMRVNLATGGWPGLWRPVLRTLLLVLVIPAAIWDADGRGLHDKAAGTVLVRA